MEERIFKIIEIILTYATWPILIGLLCFIFRTQISSLLDKIIGSRNLKISTPVGNFEGEFDLPTNIQVEVRPIDTEKSDEKEEKEKPSNWWFLDVTKALDENDEDKAKLIFETFIKENKDTIIYNFEHSFFLYKLYEHNHSETILSEIYKKIEASNIYNDKKDYINAYIMCLDYTGQYKRAIQFLIKEIEKTSEMKDEITLSIRLSRLYITDLDNLNARKTILNAISKALDNKNENLDDDLYHCYVQLAAIENADGNKVHESLCLDKALEYDPTNKETLFSSAFASIDSPLDSIQIANYKQLLNLEPEHSAALNNLGVTAQNLNLKGIATNLWASSSHTGFSLAKVNLGFVLLESGYLNAAEELANEALKADKPHENVHQLLMKISKEKVSEENKWKDAITYSKKVQKDLRNYVHYYYSERSTIPSSDIWIDESGMEVKLIVTGSMYKFSWLHEAFDINYTSSNINGTLNGFYSKKKKEDSQSTTLLSLNPKTVSGQCYGYFNIKNNCLIIFSAKVQDEIYTVLTPKD